MALEQGQETKSLGSFETEEYKASKGATTVETTATTPPTTEQTTPPTTETTPAVVPPKSEVTELSDEEYWKTISDQTGLPITSEKDLLEVLKSKKTLEQELAAERSRLSSFNPLAVDLDKAIKAGLDTDLYLDARKIDVTKLDEEQALQKAYFLKNAELHKQDPQFAKMQFEREQKAKYGVLKETLDIEQQELRKDEVDYATRARKIEVENSRKFLAEWKEKNVTIPEVEAPKAEDVSKVLAQYKIQAEEYVSSLAVLEVPIGDEIFKYGVEDRREEIKNTLADPREYLKKYGIDLETGTYDPKKFGALVMRDFALQGLPKPLTEWALERSNAKHVKQQLEGTTPPQNLSGGAVPEKTHDQKVAEAFEASRRQQAQRIR